MNARQQVEFRASCGHVMSTRADHAGHDVRCPHCHQVVRVPPSGVPYASSVSVPTGGAEPTALTALYVTALIGGLLGAGLIYLVVFDEFDESQLVTVTPLWFVPIVFGLNGLVSQRLLSRVTSARAGTMGEGAPVPTGVVGPWAALLLFPLLVLKWRSSLLVSSTAAVFWAVLLWFFFAAVFPIL
jgi:hypothetical protein